MVFGLVGLTDVLSSYKTLNIGERHLLKMIEILTFMCNIVDFETEKILHSKCRKMARGHF